jgi:hypothetical protein
MMFAATFCGLCASLFEAIANAKPNIVEPLIKGVREVRESQGPAKSDPVAKSLLWNTRVV